MANAPEFVAAVKRMTLRAWDSFGRLPSEITDQTPNELFPLLFQSPDDRPGAEISPLEALRRMNESRAKKGLPPVSKMFGKGITSVPDARV